MVNWFRRKETKRSQREREAAESVQRHGSALNVANRLLFAFRHGRSVPLAYFLSLEVGKEYSILQAITDVPNGQPLKIRVVEATPHMVVLTADYPPGAELGDHYHPDAIEHVVCNAGAVELITKTPDSAPGRLNLPPDGIAEIEPFVVHGAIADAELGCSLTVTLSLSTTTQLPL